MKSEKVIFSGNEWNNPDITSVNRVPAHTQWRACENKQLAHDIANKKHTSKWITDLNGEYEFCIFENPNEAFDFCTSGSANKLENKITVPGNWETQGYSTPIYTNWVYPWSTELDEPCVIQAKDGEEKVFNPPYLPQDNPCACYAKNFNVPQEYDGKDIILRFEGVEAAFYLWINGRAVGYSEDSKLPAEFDITDYVNTDGENRMLLMVTRFCTGTWLEDQDYWYLAGIYRSVSLVAKPKLRIQDYFITATPDLHSSKGFFSIDVELSRLDFFADAEVEVFLSDANGKQLASGSAQPSASAVYRKDAVPTANTARISFEVDNIKQWTPETPELYTVIITLKNKSGELVDTEACRTGFKSVKIENGILLLNGKRLIIRGVNRHEHAPNGRTVSREHMAEEIRQMKRMNINSVRTSHYPSCPEWYELCDEYGILIICECNIETHGVMGMLAHKPQYATQFLERAMRMVQNYKNCACIYSWSLGNESGHGANHAAMYGYIKEYDPTRICQFESGLPAKNISDIRGDMYANVSYIRKMLCNPKDDRPVIPVEYLYQICNSGGGLHKFRQLIEDYPRFQGGYIWDWQDKGLVAKTKDGTEFWGYGGDFNDSFTEKTSPLFMTCNGIVQPDLTWKPVAYEVQTVYSPVFIEDIDYPHAWAISKKANTYILKNRTLTQNTGEYECTANLRENGRIIKTESFALPQIAPGGETVFEYEIAHEKAANCEYHIDFALKPKRDSFGGNEVIFQFALPGGKLEINSTAMPAKAKPEISSNGSVISIAAGKLNAEFCTESGKLLSVKQGGKAYVLVGGELVFDRPRTGLDCEDGWDWNKFAQAFDKTEVKILSEDAAAFENSAIIKFTFAVETNAEYPLSGSIEYIVSESGIQVNYSVFASASYMYLPRAGLRFALPQGFEKLEYFGMGPNECYSDRKCSAYAGVHSSTVEQQHFAFIPPSENGGHEETRWLSLGNNDGQRIKVSGRAPFHFDVRHNLNSDYHSAWHEHELAKRDEVYLQVDAWHFPVGGDMAWSSEIDKTVLEAQKALHSLSIFVEFE